SGHIGSPRCQYANALAACSCRPLPLSCLRQSGKICATLEWHKNCSLYSRVSCKARYVRLAQRKAVQPGCREIKATCSVGKGEDTMTSKLSKTIMFALAVVLVAAPLVLAQQSDRPGSSSSGMGDGTPGSATDKPGTSPGMSGSGTTGSTPGMQSPSTGTMGAQDAIPATVTEVNHQKHTVKLHMQGGEM